MKNLYILFFLLLLLIGKPLKAQNSDIKRTWHWCFGTGAGINFSSGSPVYDTNNVMHAWEACSSISDTSGNLLFYTNGDTVWSYNNNVMNNGTGLFGHPSSAQGALIVPQVLHSNLFFVFTLDEAEDSGKQGLNYSIIDMSLNGGLGQVIVKNVLLHKPSAEQMDAVYNCDSTGIWIVAHDAWTNKLYTYLLTQSGLDTVPVISSTGIFYNFIYYAQLAEIGRAHV